jgi:hypothetical protein
MTISLTLKDDLELWAEATQNRLPQRVREPLWRKQMRQKQLVKILLVSWVGLVQF